MIKSYLKKRINSVKCCAIITTICFVLSTIGANLYAIPISEQENKKYEDIFEQTKNIDNNYGKITSSKDAKSDITVINIQDLHCHPQTQRNISKIISQIADNYNLKKIYVEGGYGNIDTNWLNSIKNENVKKQIIEKLLEDGILTGSEYYKLTHNNNIELKGIDEERIHKENIKRLAWLIQNQGKYQNIINKVNTEINILESMYVNNRNKNFNENIQKYILNKIDTKKFYKQLIKYVKDINKNPQNYNNITAIRLEDYPNIDMFLSMVSDSNKVNLKEARIELQSLIILLKNKIPFDVYSRILKETNNFTDNQKTFELITLLCEKENIDLNKNFKEVAKLLEININNKNFNPIRLVQEERQLIREIRKALSYNNDEYEITFLSDFNKYFKDYLEYKLTDANWKYFKKNYDTFRQIYSKYATIDRIKEIEYDFAEINKYYSINDKRNDIFVKNLLKDEKIYLMANDKIRNAEEILKDSKEVIVAVTGGFHSTELEEILSQKDVNTIIITPFIKDDTNKSNEKYAELIEEQSQINYQAIAYTIASCSGSKYQKQLLLKVIMEIFGKDSVSQIKEILGDVDLFEINDVEIQRTSKEDVDKLLSVINIAIDEVFVSIKSLKDIVSVDGETIDNAMLKFVSALIERGFYFNKGAIFEIVNSKFDGKDLKGISPEIYSRMFSSLQNALLKTAIKEDKYADEINAPEFSLQDLYEDTGTTEYVNIYLEDINVSPEKFAEQIYSAMQNNQLIVLNVFRTPVEIDKLDKETQKRIYEEIRNMFFKIYTDKPLYSFISQPENKDFLNYDIHFFLLEILENSFMHGNKGIDKPIFLYMNLNDQKEVEHLKIYNVNSSEDENFQMRFIRMRLALLGGQHKSNVLMKQNPYRTFEIDPDFKGKFYKVSSDIKPFYDDIAAQNLRDNSSSINYFSIFAPLQDRNKIFKILSKIPHIWEEIVFRTIPISLSVLAMSVPAVSFVTVPLTLLFFFVCQNQFIKAHNISLWIKENNLSWSTGKILRATLFNIFPDKESKVSFNKFEQQNLIISETRQRYLPTIVLSIPYIFSLIFIPNIPVIILSTIVGVAIHKVFNSTFKLKMNIFDEYSESSISMSDFLAEKAEIDLSKETVQQDLLNILNESVISEEEAIDFVKKLNLNDVSQSKYLIEILKRQRKIVNSGNKKIIKALVDDVDVNNLSQFEFVKNILFDESLYSLDENIAELLVDKFDFDNENQFNVIFYLLKNKVYNKKFTVRSLNIKILNKINVKDKKQLLTIKNKLKDILDTDLGQTEETDMLNQGVIISQIPEQEMNFTSVGQIGGYVVKTGYMKLNDGRLGNKTRGEFLAITTLTDKNGIIRYSSSELVGFANSMNNETGRINLNSKQLKLILERENYVVNVSEKFTNGELLTYRNRLKENIVRTIAPTAYGTMLSVSKQRKSVVGLLSADKANGVFIDKYASPENVTEAAKYDVSLFTGGSYSSHAGIVLREYQKTAMIVNDSRIATDGKMRIKFYSPKGDITKDGILESQQLQETEIELQPNDIVLIDTQNNKIMLFESKVFKNGETGNILFELQKYIESLFYAEKKLENLSKYEQTEEQIRQLEEQIEQDIENIKSFLEKNKNNNFIDRIIEYIYYQSSDSLILKEILSEYHEYGIEGKISDKKAPRNISKITLKITKFLNHAGSNKAYRFGEKESLDATKVGTKSANQSKLYSSIEQLKRETGIDNVRVSNGLAIDSAILEDLLGQEYKSLYSEFESIIKSKNNTEENLQRIQEISSRINELISNISNSKIKEYIGKKNLRDFKNKLSIVRSSGVGEDNKDFSAAGIAESYGKVEYENISQNIRDVLSSFFSQKAIYYMINSGNVIKPAVLVEEWIDADKAGIMMSENSNGDAVIQVVNGSGEDIVSGRITPYSFIIDNKKWEKIDGNYTNEKTLTSQMLSDLTKIMRWLEQVEGVPVDVEFLIKDNIIYIVQTTLDNYKYEKQEQIIDIEQPEYAEQEDESEILQNEDEGFGEVIDINADDFLTEEDNGYPKKKSVNKSKKNKSGKKTKTNKKKSKDKKSKTKKTTVSSSSVSSENDDDIRQPRGFTRQRIIQNFTKLAQSKDSFDSSLELNQQQIKDVLLRYGLSKHEVEKINFSDGLPDYIVSLLKSKNSQVVGTTIDINKSLIENLKEHPILFSLALETFTRVYENEFDENATFGDLLSLISRRCAKRLYEATCTDLRGYFGEIYAVNTLIAGFIPDKRAGPIIIRPELPEDNNIRGFDIYDIDRVKIQVKTGGSGIVHHHEDRYSRVGSIMDIEREIEQGLIEIPVLTTKNVKNNSFSSDDRVQGMDVTTEAVTKFAHEFVSALYGIGYKKNISAVRDLKLKDLINSFKEIPTANPITKEELIDLLTNKNQLMDNKRIKDKKDKKEEPQVVDINQQLINIDDLVNQNVVVRTKSRDVHVLYIDKNSIFLNDHSLEEQSRRVLESDDFSLYGISSVEYDDSGKIKNILFAEGTELSFLKQDGEPVGSKDKAENSSFSPEELNALYKDTNAKDYVDIYLDGDIDEICHLIKQAATKTKNKNKLIILHLFKDNFKTSELTPSQLFELYRKINVFFSRRFKLSDIFPNSNVYSQYTDYDIDFFFKQILKNALISGNSGNVELPIALNIKLDENENIQNFSVYNKSRSEDADIDEDKKVLATSAHLMLTGDSKSTEIMTHNSVREYSFNEKYEVGNTSFRKAEVSLRDSIDMRMYYLEQQYKQSEENVSISDIALQLGPTVRDLYIRGLEKYTKKYLKETGKTKEELTLEEILEIEEYAKHYNSTVSGIFYGVWLEKFSFFSKDFLSSHTNISFAGKVAYGVILSLSVAVGISCAVLSFSMLPIVMAIISTALLSPFSTVLSSMIMHSLWNLVNRNDMLQKDGNIRKDLVGVLKPVNLRKEIKDSEISSTFIEQAKLNGVEFISIYDLVKYLRKLRKKDFKNNEGIEIYRGPKPIESVRPVFLRRLDRKTPEEKFEDDCRIVENSFGFALGLTWTSIFKGSKRKVNLVKAISKKNNIVSWENGYKYFYGPKYPATPPEDYMDKIRNMCLKYDKKIFFFLPRNLMSHDLSFKTRREIEYIQQHPEMMKNVVFVFGTYDCFNIRNANIFGQYFNEDKIATTLRRLFSNPNAFISHKVSKISDRGLAKFFRNMSKLSVNGVFETIDVLKELEFSKKQDIEENEEAVLSLKTDIVENNRRQVCFICTANINRSAVSHLLFEDRLSKLGVDNISVVSAGLLPIAQTINEENLYLGQDYKKILEDFDVDPDLIDKFRSEEFAQKHIASDYFIVVSQKHKNLLIEKYNIAPDKIILYSDLDSDLIGDALPDPQKLKISKRDIVKLVNNIFDNSLFNFISNLKVEKILEILFKVKSAFIKYIAVNYNNIKSSEIEQILKMYEEENLVGEKATADKEKFIDVYIVEDIGNLKGKYTLINTGIKADGKDIFKVQIDNLLIYGAKNVPRIKVVKALNETEQIKNEVKSILSIQGNIEIEGIVRRNGDGIGINDGLLEIGNMEFEKIQASQIKEFELSCLEIKHVLGIMCGEKTLIDLKSLSQEELLTAIESGRARKVITLEQYNQLMKLNLLNSDKISELLKNGIEIYVQSNDINISCAQNKIAGQIIEEGNKKYIYDYYTKDKIELKELTDEEDLLNLEKTIISSDGPVLVDIEILKKSFQGSNPIESITKLGTLAGKIKITMGLRNVNMKDIINIGYSVKFDKVPDLSLKDIQSLVETEDKETIINILGQTNVFSILFKSVENADILMELKNIVIERTLTKQKLSEEGVLIPEKSLEIMLGKLLRRQVEKQYSLDSESDENINKKVNEKIGSIKKGDVKDELIKNIEALKTLDDKKISEFDTIEQQVLVESIIQIILFDGEIIIQNQSQQIEEIDMSSLRAMLSAA